MRQVINHLDAAWQEWKRANPNAYELYRRFAREALAKQRRFGIGQLTERVRWEAKMTWHRDEEGFKINNNFRAYIARDLLVEFPGLELLLETRRVRNELELAA